MAEKELVTQEDKADGAILLQQLDRANFPVSAAFWANDPILETWRLIIAAPRPAIESLVEAYGTIQRIINDNGLEVTLDRISLIPDQDPKLANLQALAESDAPDVIEASAGRVEVGGRIFDDIHLYRTNALRYEQEVLEVLQRTQAPNPTMRVSQGVLLPNGVEADAILEDDAHAIVVEIKLRSRPVDTRDIHTFQGRLYAISRYLNRHPSAILVSRSGFTTSALDAVENSQIVLVQWTGHDDDNKLVSALSEARARSEA